MRSGQTLGLGMVAVLFAAVATQAQPPRSGLVVELKRAPEVIAVGGEARFTIILRNDGPVAISDVVVRATLSEGLDHEQGPELEQSVGRIGAGQRIVLDALQAKAVAPGGQSCSVAVKGVGSLEARGKAELAVVRD